MTTAAILDECARRGVTLRADGDLIRYRPRHAVDDEIRDAMRERKPELLAYLRRSGNGVGPYQPPGIPEHRRCWSCGGGLQRDDADSDACGTCRWTFEHLEPRRPQ